MNVHISASAAARELAYRRTRRAAFIAYPQSIDIPDAPVRKDDPECEDFHAVEGRLGLIIFSG